MSFWDDIEKIAGHVEKDIDKVFDGAKADLDKALASIKDGVAAAEARLAKEAKSDITKFFNDKILEVQNKHGDAIAVLQNAASNVSAADHQSIKDDLVTICTPDSADGDKQSAASALQSLLTSPSMKTSTASIQSKGGQSVSVGVGGEIDLIIGVAGDGGYGMKIGSTGDSCVLLNFAGSAGSQIGIDGALTLSFWVKSPKDLKGGFFGATVQGTAGAGSGMIVYFSMNGGVSFEGIALPIAAGLELQAAVVVGFTVAVPKNF